MKIENLVGNKESSPQNPKLAMDSEAGKPNLEILDNYKNMWSETLNNNNIQSQIPEIAAPPPENIYDLFSPGTSKLKKILMTSKSPEPINLTNYRRQSTDALESPGALDKNFETTTTCDNKKEEVAGNSNQLTPEKMSLNSTLPNISLSSLSVNSSGYTPEGTPEKPQILNTNKTQDNTVIEPTNLSSSRELLPYNPQPIGNLSSLNPQLSGILSSSPLKTTVAATQSPNIAALLASTPTPSKIWP